MIYLTRAIGQLITYFKGMGVIRIFYFMKNTLFQSLTLANVDILIHIKKNYLVHENKKNMRVCLDFKKHTQNHHYLICNYTCIEKKTTVK